MLLSPSNQIWLQQFIKSKRRKPRVLHIGNIANNAYNNAKLLNSVGLDNDVICYDYYHSMGCPEWEDADLAGAIADDFHPKWHELQLAGFQRPRWFAQGPMLLCIQYLLAKCHGSINANDLWEEIQVSNLTIAPKSENKILQYDQIWKIFRKKCGSSWKYLVSIFILPPKIAYIGFLKKIAFCVGFPVGAILAILAMLIWWPIRLSIPLFHAFDKTHNFDECVLDLLRTWNHEFPERRDKLSAEDLLHYRFVLPHWRALFNNYDFILAYSTDGIYPLLAGIPYLAFEHGTIRDIPFQATPQGRCTALVYRKAKHSFVTNFDCRHSAEKLAPAKFTLINHPYDEDRGIDISDWQEVRKVLQAKLRCKFICFFPTRHDWVEGTGYADKSNDMFLLAVANLRKLGLRIGVICCEWGANVKQSQALILQNGIEDQVHWEAPMAMREFERTARASDAVVDQFKLGSFGGITFKALAVGVPVLTFLDEKSLREQYAEIPPVINCSNQDEIETKLTQYMSDSSSLRGLGLASQAWMKKYHGKRETINLQIDQFRANCVSHS